MRTTMRRSPLMLTVWLCLAMMIMVNGPAEGDNWKDYYQDAEKAREKAVESGRAGDAEKKREYYLQAIALLEKALEDDPEPSRRKKSGFRSTEYFPYLSLGLAYLGLEDFETAYNYCLLSQEKYASRVAQSKKEQDDTYEKLLNRCLLFAKPFELPTPKTSDTITAADIPTASPEPIATPTPISKPTAPPTPLPEPTATPMPLPEPTASPTPLPEPTEAPLLLTPTATPILVPSPPLPSPESPKPEPTPLPGKSRQGNIYAVIIGIGDYQDPRIPDLRFTVSDARALYKLLTNFDYGGISPENIRLLLDDEATDRNIKRAIGKWLAGKASPDDTVLIYYSGHGAPEGGETYWVTYNAAIDDLYTTALNNNAITDMLGRVEAKRIITFLDSCYSAATVNLPNQTRALQTEIPWQKFTGEGRVVMSASDGTQLSLELEEFGHGVFTYYLLEGLRGAADQNQDFWVEVDEIWDYVKHQVSETARKKGNPQTPVLQGQFSAGIPVTFLRDQYMTWNRVHSACQRWEEFKTQRMQAIESKRARLTDLLREQKISTEHFNCAFKMLSLRFRITELSMNSLRNPTESAPLPDDVLVQLTGMQDHLYPSEATFKTALAGTLGTEAAEEYHCLIMLNTLATEPILEGFLEGRISLDVFNAAFQCQLE